MRTYLQTELFLCNQKIVYLNCYCDTSFLFGYMSGLGKSKNGCKKWNIFCWNRKLSQTKPHQFHLKLIVVEHQNLRAIKWEYSFRKGFIPLCLFFKHLLMENHAQIIKMLEEKKYKLFFLQSQSHGLQATINSY